MHWRGAKMKINNGFVTNSSSTSFVVCTKNGLNKEKVLDAFGLTSESLLLNFYEKLYYAIDQHKELVPPNIDLESFFEEHRIYINDPEDFLEIKRRYDFGEKIYYGKLSDSGDYGRMIEAFYSHESIVVIGDDIYFNAKDSAY